MTQLVLSQSLVNFQHLKHLTERVEMRGDTVDIVHVYANYPAYEWVEAKDTGTEGVACVDDAARAAVVYLRHYELTKDPNSRDLAVALLKFVLHMQADDGTFFNFLYADHTINKTGETSKATFGWWTGRAIWALGLSYRILRQEDPVFAKTLQTALKKSFWHLDTLLKSYGKTRDYGKYRSPRWLLYEEGSDATTELGLGLLEYYKATRDPKIKQVITRLAEGMVMMQDGDMSKFPYGLHRSWRTMWHMWGNSQSAVLAAAGKEFHKPSLVKSAELEARSFYSRLLINGFMKELDVSVPEKRTEFEQIAYGVRPMAIGFIRLYEATRDKDYLVLAGLAASWLFGNNVLHQQMYDPETGRCFDGITDSTKVNKNSGAESTIEALLTVEELERYPEALHSMRSVKSTSGSKGDLEYATFRREGEEELTLVLDYGSDRFTVLKGKESKAFQERLR
ncbi:MAG: hypothetical protein WBD36_12235 [Bacteroidota bacterium]